MVFNTMGPPLMVGSFQYSPMKIKLAGFTPHMLGYKFGKHSITPSCMDIWVILNFFANMCRVHAILYGFIGRTFT